MSRETIKRDGQFAKAVDDLAKVAGDRARETILKRDAPITKKDVIKLAKHFGVCVGTLVQWRAVLRAHASGAIKTKG